jgi:hypothetical protein
MHPSDDPLYARISTLSEAELFIYIQHYTRYKAEAVQAAIAELHTRGLHVPNDALAEIEGYFTRKEHQLMRPFNLDPSQVRWLSYALFTIGICSAILLYATATASPSPHQPLGYDPFTSKKYMRELELYGGKSNILAVEFRQWFASLWRGKNLAYTIAVFTVLLSSLLWLMGSPSASNHEVQSEKYHAP